jgi:hypothetical protein
MPPKPAKRNSQAVATAPQSEEMAGSLSDPAILRQGRALAAGFTFATAMAFSGPIPPPEVKSRISKRMGLTQS